MTFSHLLHIGAEALYIHFDLDSHRQGSMIRIPETTDTHSSDVLIRCSKCGINVAYVYVCGRIDAVVAFITVAASVAERDTLHCSNKR